MPAPLLIVTAIEAFHVGLAAVVFFAAVGYFLWRDYKKVCRRTDAMRGPVAVEPVPESVPDFGFDEVDWSHLKPSAAPEAHVEFGERAA
jgi:hypothetical protein